MLNVCIILEEKKTVDLWCLSTNMISATCCASVLLPSSCRWQHTIPTKMHTNTISDSAVPSWKLKCRIIVNKTGAAICTGVNAIGTMLTFRQKGIETCVNHRANTQSGYLRSGTIVCWRASENAAAAGKSVRIVQIARVRPPIGSTGCYLSNMCVCECATMGMRDSWSIFWDTWAVHFGNN